MARVLFYPRVGFQHVVDHWVFYHKWVFHTWYQRWFYHVWEIHTWISHVWEIHTLKKTNLFPYREKDRFRKPIREELCRTTSAAPTQEWEFAVYLPAQAQNAPSTMP